MTVLAVAGVKSRVVAPLHQQVGIPDEARAWARLRDYAAEKAMSLTVPAEVEDEVF